MAEDIRSRDEDTARALAVQVEDSKLEPSRVPAMSNRFDVISDAGESGDLVDRWAVWDRLMDWPACKTRRLPAADLCELDRESAELEAAALNAEYAMVHAHGVAVPA